MTTETLVMMIVLFVFTFAHSVIRKLSSLLILIMYAIFVLLQINDHLLQFIVLVDLIFSLLVTEIETRR